MSHELGGRADSGTPPPKVCPSCAQDLSDFPYYQQTPCPIARRLQKLAALLLPVMSVVFLVQMFSGAFPVSFHVASGYFIIAYVSTPSLLLVALSMLFPRDRRVICLHCSWYRDYPFRWGEKLFEARPSPGTEQPAP